jgi:transposase InsO family protein
MEETIIDFYKDPKKGLNIQNAFRNLLKAGYKVTLRQAENAIKGLDEYHKARVYKEQKNLFLKTVTGTMSDYQADTFFIKQHSKSMVKIVALINIETRKGYVYHVPNLKKLTVIDIFNQWLKAVPENQYPRRITSDLGSEFNSKEFYSWLENKNIKLCYVNKSDYKTSLLIDLLEL